MLQQTHNQLRDVTRAFYETAGDAFARARQRPWAGWARVALSIGRGASVLDLGCGHGRFAAYLAGLGPSRQPHAYLGMDQSHTMLELARARDLPDWASFAHGDLLANATSATAQLRAGPGADGTGNGGGYDLVTLFAVLHHIPSQAARMAVLRWALGQVAPGGLLAVTLWRFDESPRMADMRLPEAAFGQLGIEGPTEPGDCLLRFGVQHGAPARYCHFPTPSQLSEYLALERAELLADYRPSWGDIFNQYLLFRTLR